MRKLWAIVFIIGCFKSFATHNRAGEITYKRIAPFTTVSGGITVPYYKYLITVTKYTDHGSSIADRCVDTIYFGDGSSDIAARVNGGSGLSCGCPNCGTIILSNAGYTV